MCDLKTHWYWIWCDPHCLIALCEWMEFSKIDESYPIIKYLDGKQKPGSYVTWLFPWRSYQCRCSMRSRFYSLNDYIEDFNKI